MPIKLLVSVRDADEATVALQAGVDIIDVKEPSEGPLGFAGARVIQSVLDVVGDRVPVSAALGECNDWIRTTPTANSVEASPALRYVKLGLAGMKNATPGYATPDDLDSGVSNSSAPTASANECLWTELWQQARINCLKDLPVNAETAWVAVAYSDADRANSPAISEVLQSAATRNCTVFLLDTFIKDGKTTLDWLDESELQGVREEAKSLGLQFALAGQLSSAHLTYVKNICPDIFAVRGAVCEHTDRRQSISAQKIRQLQQRLAEL